MNVTVRIASAVEGAAVVVLTASIIVSPAGAEPTAGDGADLVQSTSLELELWPLTDSEDVLLAAFQDEPGSAFDADLDDADRGPAEGETGTDPRDFGNKFMPYYRYTELKNDIEIQELTLFGLFAFNPRFAMTYELPVAKYFDYSDFGPFKAGMGIPPGDGSPPSGGVPFPDLDPDGDEVGVGDLILRFFSRPRALEWEYGEEGDHGHS